MQTYKIEATVPSSGTLTITGVPFEAGHRVEVVVRDSPANGETSDRYPLRGKPIRYVDPFEAAADRDWDALK